MWFHKHKWEEVERFYNPPNREIVNISGAGQDLLKQLAFGITIILYKCNCSEMKSIEVLGKMEKK